MFGRLIIPFARIIISFSRDLILFAQIINPFFKFTRSYSVCTESNFSNKKTCVCPKDTTILFLLQDISVMVRQVHGVREFCPTFGFIVTYKNFRTFLGNAHGRLHYIFADN